MPERRLTQDRRQAADRRARERRRKGDSRVFVIELTGAELRVAQLVRAAPGGVDEVSAWAVRWRQEAATLDSPAGRSELTAALREAARRHNMFTADVRIVLSGQYCVTRTVRGPLDEVRAELQQLEQRSRLYLALGPGEKVLVSHVKMLDARHSHALAAACNTSILEAVQAAAETAGLEVTMIEPALSALARAVSRLPGIPAEPYLLIHFDESTTEIGVCHEGQLLLDYRPGGATKVADLPALLASHLYRLDRHVGRYLRTSSSGLKQVLLCGEPEAVAAAALQFKRHSALEVRAVRPGDVQATWTLTPGAAEAATAPALGGLLLAYMPADEYDAPNLMQHILAGKLEPLRPRLVRSAIPVAATLLAALMLGWINARRGDELAAMQAQIDGLAISAARATELRLQLVTAESKLTQLEQLATQLPGVLGGETISRVAECMPADVWLSQLTLADGSTGVLHGASYQEAGVYDFVRWMEKAPGFLDVALKSTTAATIASGPATSFELELTLGESNDQATQVARHE
jgi:hypothetical protein